MSFPLVGNLSEMLLSKRLWKDSGQAGMTTIETEFAVNNHLNPWILESSNPVFKNHVRNIF